MGIRVGIDLGTCYSSLAYVDSMAEELVLIPNVEGELKTPSIMVALSDKTLFYGQEALDKRLAGEGDMVALTSDYLSYLLEMARQRVGQEITEAVITVPTFYTDGERRNLKEMLGEAGVQVVGIINEPTAAALAYSYRNPNTKRKVLIYKLGGGTFETAVADLNNAQVQILGAIGSRDLGGREWEDVIASYIKDQFYREFKVDFTEDKLEGIKIRELAEQVLIRLSQVSGAEAVVRYKGYTGRYYITRDMLFMMTKTMLALTVDMIKRLLSSLNIKEPEVDGILFSGGATKIPMLREYVEKELGCTGIMGVNTDYDVVYGAAIKAWLWKRNTNEKSRIHEVVANSIGMISVSIDGAWFVNSILIHKNTRIPISNTRTFLLSVGKKGGRMTIYLLQGEGAVPKDCIVVGKYIIDHIEYIEGGKTLIDVTFSYDEDAIIHIQARQREKGELLAIHREPIPLDMEWVNQQPQIIEEEIAKEEVGIVYFCVDLSGSMAGLPFVEAKRALRRIASELDLTCKKVGIIGFSDQSQFILPPTDNINNINRTLQRLHISGRMFGYGNGTSPFAAVYEKHCQNEKELKEEVAMVVVTDGAWPDKERAMQIAGLCKEKGITVYTMAFGRADTEYLSRLASLKEVSDFTEKKKGKGEWLTIAQIVSENQSE